MSEINQEAIQSRYNIDTPVNVISTVLLATGFLLRNKHLLNIDEVSAFLGEVTGITTDILTGKLKVTTEGFLSQSSDVSNVLPERVN